MSKTETVGFHFQTVTLQDAQNMALAGGGLYSGLKTELLERIPKLNAHESFVFGLPESKAPLTKTELKGITMSVNGTLRKADLPWSIRYVEAKKLFVGVPQNGKRYLKKEKRSMRDSIQEDSDSARGLGLAVNELMDIASKTFNVQAFEGRSGPMPDYRSAICRVGVEVAHIPSKVVAKHLGITDDGVIYHVKTKRDSLAYQKLLSAVKGAI